MIELLQKLDTAFRDITYYDESHEYYFRDKKCISTTQLLKKYKKPFDNNYWSSKKAKERGVPQQVIKDEWKYKADRQSLKGKILHDYIENKLANKVFPYDSSLVKLNFGNDPIYDDYLKLKSQADNFIENIKGKMIPVKSEFVLGDYELGLCGMTDQIFFNNKSGMFEIWDWKQNGDLKTSSKYNLINSLSHLDDSDLTVYSLQLSVYKYIIEKHTGVKFGNCYLVWFNENNPNYTCLKCHDVMKESMQICEELIYDQTI